MKCHRTNYKATCNSVWIKDVFSVIVQQKWRHEGYVTLSLGYAGDTVYSIDYCIVYEKGME